MVRIYTYGAAASSFINLKDRGTTDIKTSATIASGDFKISKDGGAFANLGTLPSELPSAGGSILLALSSSELTCQRAIIQWIDQTSPKEWEDGSIVIETYGASGLHTRIGSTLIDNLDVTVSSRLASASYITPATSAQNATAVWQSSTAINYGGASLGNLLSSNIDVAISTRLASASYIVPPTSALVAEAVWNHNLEESEHPVGSSGEYLSLIKAKTDLLTFNASSVFAWLASGTHTNVTIPTITSLTNPVVASSVTAPVTAYTTNTVNAIVSGTVTLASGTHTGATVPTVTNVTNAVTINQPVSATISGVVTATVSGTVTLAPGVHTGATIPNVTSVASANLNLAQSVPTTNTAQTVGDALNAARADGFGKWVLAGTTLTLYADDGTTVVKTFTLNDATNPTSRT